MNKLTSKNLSLLKQLQSLKITLHVSCTLRTPKHCSDDYNHVFLYRTDITVTAVMHTTDKDHQAAVTDNALGTHHRLVAVHPQSASIQVHIILRVFHM